MNEFAHGAAAARAGEPMSACPWSPSTAEGKAWHRGWFSAERERRHLSGQAMADTLRMKAEARTSAEQMDPRRYGMNPVDALVLEVAPERPASVGISVPMDLDAVRKAWEEFAKEFARVTSQVVDTVRPFLEQVASMMDAAEEKRPENIERRRHGVASMCPRHGPTKGGFCRRCAR